MPRPILAAVALAFMAALAGPAVAVPRPAHRPVCVPVMIEMIPSLICARPSWRAKASG